MVNQVSENMSVETPPKQVKKAWKKPVLDILELESAQHGTSGLPDGNIRHHSA
jgi:hypothetical protein